MPKTNIENRKGFDKGWNEAKQKLADLKSDIMKVLGVKTDASFFCYKNGKASLGYAKRTMLKETFRKYGIEEPFDE